MNRHFGLSALFSLICTGVFALERTPVYLAADQTAALIANEGRKVIVYGETEGSEKSASGTNYVHFKGSEFFLVTFKSDLGAFKKGEPHLAYNQKRLAVEGVVALREGKPQIKLTAPAQITVLEPGAVFPPPTAEKNETVAGSVEKKAGSAAAGETSASPPEVIKPKPPVDPSEYFKK